MENFKDNYNKITDLEDELHIHINSAGKNQQNLQTTVNTMQQNLQNVQTSVETLDTQCIKQGGTLTKPLTVTGGDSATAGKIIFTSNGQITDSNTATLLGLSNGALLTGHGSYALKLRGNTLHPVYNNSNVALLSDIPNVDSTPTNGSTNNITSGGVYSALLNKENNANKVTSISSSSTDSQYPSAKCVYDAIQNAGGGGGGSPLVIETQLYDFTAAPLVANRNIYQTVCYIQAPVGAVALVTIKFCINTNEGETNTTGKANIFIRDNNVAKTQLLVAKGTVDTEYTLTYRYVGTGNKDNISARIQSVSSTSKACVKSLLLTVLGQNIEVTYQ